MSVHFIENIPSLCLCASLLPLHSLLVKKQNESHVHFPVGEEECMDDSLPAVGPAS